MAKLELVRNDKGYDLKFTILDAQQDPVDLYNATVMFKVKKPGAVGLEINSACTVVDEANGIVTYTVQDGDFDTVGRFIGELEVTWTGGKVMTASDLHIDIVPDLT